MSEAAAILAEKDDRKEQMQAVLYGYRAAVELTLKEIDITEQLALPHGIPTDLSTKIGGLIDDPIGSLVSLSREIDDKIFFVLNRMTIALFKKRAEFILSVVKDEKAKDGLRYFISLKEDSPENRDQFLDFLYDYNQTDSSRKFPIDFLFLSEDKLQEVHGERIELA